MYETEPFNGQELLNGGSSFWYGFSISYDLSTAPEDRHYKVSIFRTDYPTEEVVGHTWAIDMTYNAWFQTLEEATTAAKAFLDEMHWQREVENLGVGKELRKQAEEEVLKVANELRKVWELEPDKLNSRFRYYDDTDIEELSKVISNKSGDPVIRIESADNNEFIFIEALERTQLTSTDYWDGNWLNTEVTIKVGGFRGHVGGYLRTDEFATFREEVTALYSTLSGSATFRTMEEWLLIEMIGDGKGHITAEGSLIDNPGIGNTVRFKLELDQTFLPSLLEELNTLIDRYPIIGSD